MLVLPLWGITNMNVVKCRIYLLLEKGMCEVDKDNKVRELFKLFLVIKTYMEEMYIYMVLI